MEMVRSLITRWNLLLVALAFLGALGAGAAVAAVPAYAQQPSPEVLNHMERIASGLYCPVCVGVPLNVCETTACEQWRNLIIQKIQNGESDEQIRQYFIDQYGDRVLGAPPPEGFNLGAYVLPLAILIGGAAVLFFTMRGWLRSRGPAGIPATVPPVPPEYAERIARELRDRE